MKVQDVQDRGDVLVISIPDTKTNKPRTSCITEPLWVDIVKMYKSKRPPGQEIIRFFLFYSNNKCTKQPVGIHSFGSMPVKIATFLNLENPAQYTGHCFRRSSATVLAGHGADITTLKRHGGWKSTTVAEGYIEDSLKSKIAIANQLVGTSLPQASTSFGNMQQPPNSHVQNIQSSMQNIQFKSGSDSNLPTINISNCNNCTFKFK
jgi:integrase